MKRRRWALLGAVSCVLAVAAPAAGHDEPVVKVRIGTCPNAALRLTTRDVPTAKRAVVVAAPELYRDRQHQTVRATGGGLAPVYLRTRGAKECGARIFRRTVVVDVVFPRIARYSASLSQATFLVSRITGGWLIWGQPH